MKQIMSDFMSLFFGEKDYSWRERIIFMSNTADIGISDLHKDGALEKRT